MLWPQAQISPAPMQQASAMLGCLVKFHALNYTENQCLQCLSPLPSCVLLLGTPGLCISSGQARLTLAEQEGGPCTPAFAHD